MKPEENKTWISRLKFLRSMPRVVCVPGALRQAGIGRSRCLGELVQVASAMISQTAEYALRAMLCLAARNGVASGTSAIAESTRVPAGYLSKVLQALARRGLVISTSGRRGGFRLARSATEVSVLDVIQAVAPFARIRKCPLGIGSHDGQLCPLHRRLDEAMESFEKAFAAVTIAELLQEGHGSLPLCESSGGGHDPTAPANGGLVGPGRKGPKERGQRTGRHPR